MIKMNCPVIRIEPFRRGVGFAFTRRAPADLAARPRREIVDGGVQQKPSLSGDREIRIPHIGAIPVKECGRFPVLSRGRPDHPGPAGGMVVMRGRLTEGRIPMALEPGQRGVLDPLDAGDLIFATSSQIPNRIPAYILDGVVHKGSC